MIGRLVGQVAHEEPTGGLLLDVGGVGYELACPVGTAQKAKTTGHSIIVFVQTVLRQDALELFGFSSNDEREAFRLLVAVPNVGPRLALSVLNVLPAADLAVAIEAEDKARLGRVPGVGKKTAERLVLELRGKMTPISSQTAHTAQTPGPNLATPARLVAALVGLGYRTQEAERAAKALLSSDRQPEKDLSGLLREALKYLAA